MFRLFMCNPWHQESRLLRDGKDLSGHVLICQSKEDCSQAVQQKAMSRLWPSRVPISARFFFFLIIYLFIFGCTGYLLLFLVVVSGGYSLQWLPWRSTGCRWTGFSMLWQRGSGALEYAGPSSGGTWALAAQGMWSLPRSGIEVMSSALAGGLLATAPPAKSGSEILFHLQICS